MQIAAVAPGVPRFRIVEKKVLDNCTARGLEASFTPPDVAVEKKKRKKEK